jgi:hypothetical protein
MSPICPPPWHFTTWFDALDHWQTLAAGLVAILAALIAVSVPECFARRRDRREIEALRKALAGEIRLYIDLLINIRDILRKPETSLHSQGDLRALNVLHPPTVYPALAAKMGLIRRPRAVDVVEFFGTIERLNFTERAATTEPTRSVLGSNYDTLLNVFEEACRRVMPLLSELPVDDRADAQLRART